MGRNPFLCVFCTLSIALLLSISACTTDEPLPPDIPEGLLVTDPTPTSLTISWSESPRATAYELYRDSSAAGQFTEMVYLDTGTSCVDSALEPGTVYWYRVLASGRGGKSGLSPAVSGETHSGVPSAPTGLKAAIVSDTYIELVWDAMPYATSYELYWDSSAAGSFPESHKLHDGAATSCVHQGLTADTDYYYKVRSKSSYGTSGFSGPLLVTARTVSGTVTVD